MTPNSLAPLHNESCPIAYQTLTPNSMAPISMTPHSMAPKPAPVLTGGGSSEETFLPRSPPTVVPAVSSDALSLETLYLDLISSSTVSLEIMWSALLLPEAMVSETIIPEATVDCTPAPTTVSKAMFTNPGQPIKALPNTSTKSIKKASSSKNKKSQKFTFNFVSSKSNFVSSKAMATKEIAASTGIRKLSGKLVSDPLGNESQPRHSKREESLGNNTPKRFFHLSTDKRTRPRNADKDRSRQQWCQRTLAAHLCPNMISSSLCTTKDRRQQITTSVSNKKELTVARRSRHGNALSKVESIFSTSPPHKNVIATKSMDIKPLERKMNSSSMPVRAAKTNIKLANRIDVNSIINQKMNPNIKAAKALTSRAIFELAAKAFVRKAKSSKSRGPRRRLPKLCRKIPASLRAEEELYPFKLVPSPIEERFLETSISSYIT